MATHSSVLAWRIPGTEEPRGLLSTGSHRIRHGWSDLAAAACINTYIYIYVCICVSGRCVRSSPCRVHGTSEMSGCAGSHWQSTPGSNTPLDAEITQNTRQSQLWPEGHVLGRKNTHINIFTWNNNGRLKNQKQQRKKKKLKQSERFFLTPGTSMPFKTSCPNPPRPQHHHLPHSSSHEISIWHTLSSTYFWSILSPQ